MTTDPVGTAASVFLFALAATVLLATVFYGRVKRVVSGWWEAWKEARAERRIRWYNRLAAWLYPLITDPLMNLAIPVWDEEAERDFKENSGL